LFRNPESEELLIPKSAIKNPKSAIHNPNIQSAIQNPKSAIKMRHRIEKPETKSGEVHKKTPIKDINTPLTVSLKFEEADNNIELSIKLNCEQVSDIFQQVLSKPVKVSFSISEPVSANLSNISGIALTNREIDIMNKLSQGLYYKEIAEDLGISVQTVKNHLKNIYSKFRVVNRSEAIIRYLNLPENKSKASSGI
jgi:DNA-binding CsgD family transcriptional regulator